MGIKGGCSNAGCCASTGLHADDDVSLSGMTFGSGRLDENGYWEFPCDPCARAFEVAFPEATPCWPFPSQDLNQTRKDWLKSYEREESIWKKFDKDFPELAED